MLSNFFASPLEQFQILPIININLGFLDFSITNETVILFVILAMVVFTIYLLLNKDMTLDIVPDTVQLFFQTIYELTLCMVYANVKHAKNRIFFPFLFSFFMLVFSLNIIGLIPYSFTLTSHLVVTLFLSLFCFLGINIISAKMYKIHFFSLFLPPGTSLGLAFLLVPIETISYMFKPISLAVRLFANLMAGHTLLKVILGFVYTLLGGSGIIFVLHYVPVFFFLAMFPALAVSN